MAHRAPSIATSVPEHINVLVLSGGAANGAWGAGVLNGWHDSNQIPEFDIVTGISTGALSSTAAFLHDYKLLREAYTTVGTSDIVEPRVLGNPLLGILCTDSMYGSEPLQRLIKKQIPNSVIDKVAAEGTVTGRGLFVGTTNMDTGEFYIWDMVKIAQESGPEHYDRYRSIILASASIPVIFNPVFIDKSMHSDGGVREQLFFREELVTGMHQGMKSFPSKATVYVIVNGDLSPPAAGKSGTPNCSMPILLQTLSVMENAGELYVLFATQVRAASLGLDFAYCSIPKGTATIDFQNFGPSDMQALYQKGFDWGSKPSWQTAVDPPAVIVSK